MAEDYRGGYWRFYTLGKAGFYLVPEDYWVFTVSGDNYFYGQLLADSPGVVDCLYAYSHLSLNCDEPYAKICAWQFHLPRYFKLDYAEVVAIDWGR